MAALKWASTGLGWGGGLSRLRTPSAAPWDGDSTPKGNFSQLRDKFSRSDSLKEKGWMGGGAIAG